jgi:hypothetical protein
MRYRKKPIVIEAIQLTWENWPDICDHMEVGELSDGRPEGLLVGKDGIGLKIPTLEGIMRASEGDWIIKGIKGEIYACKPDIFKETYEEVKP